MKSLHIAKQIEIDSTYRDRVRDPFPADFTVRLSQSGQSISGLSSISPISNDVIVYPPQNPIGSSQLQIESLAFFNNTLVDPAVVESRNYLPYMFSVSSTSDTLLRLDELPIASTIPTTTDIEPSTDLPRNTIPLGKADNFYIDNFLENVATGELRKIIGFSFSSTPDTLQTVKVISYTINGTDVLIELDRFSDNSIIPSNVDRFYQGKSIEFSDGTQRLITDFYLNDIGNPILKIESPLQSSPVMGSNALIISPENWLVKIETPFSTEIPEYPAYREPTSGSNIIYEKLGLDTQNKAFSMDTIRHTDDTIGIAIQTSTQVLYYHSNDAEGTTWNGPVVIDENLNGYANLGEHGIDLTVIDDGVNTYPAIIFGGDESGDSKLFYARATAENGSTWNAASIVMVGLNDIEIASGSLIKVQPIPAQGINATGVPVNPGFPQIAYSDASDRIVSVLQGSVDHDTPTWTRDSLLQQGFVGQLADLSTHVNAPFVRYDNGTLATDLMMRSILTFKFTSVGVLVGRNEDEIDIDVGGGPVTVIIDNGYYASLDDIGTEIASKLNAAGLGVGYTSFTAVFSGEVITIDTNTASTFEIEASNLATALGFTNTPTGFATSHTSPNDNTFTRTVPNKMGIITKSSSNNEWIFDGSVTGATSTITGFQSFSTMSTTIPAGTDGTAIERPLLGEPDGVNLLVLTWTDSTSGENRLLAEKFIASMSASAYQGFFGNGEVVPSVGIVTDLSPLLTDYTDASTNTYPTSNIPITSSFISGDTITNTDFVANNLSVSIPYVAETANNINVFDTLANNRNDAPFIVFQAQDSSINLLIPNLNTFDVGVQYKIREGPANITSDSGSILTGNTTQMTVSSSLVSNTPGFYTGSFLHVFNQIDNPVPDPFVSFNDYRQIIQYTGNTADTSVTPTIPAYTFVVDPPFSGDVTATSVNWELLSFSSDIFSPLVYVGSQVSVNQMVCYEIELTSLILPNIILATGQGNRIAFYPYVYVEFTNLTAQNRNVLYSNNPNAVKASFRVPITNTVDPERSTFVPLSGKGVTQTIPFKPNDNFHFKVTLSNGELFKTLITDTSFPFPPDPNIQVSASFGIRRVTEGGTCGP